MKVFLYTAGDPNSHKELGRKLQELESGKEYIIEVKKNRAIRSLSQNKYYWVILQIIAISTGEYDKDTLHDTCKKKFNGHWVHFPSGDEYLGKSTSDLDSAEFTAYLNRVKQWALEEFNIIIPEPKDIDYKRWMEIENSYDEHFHG
jgi:hypothetical protein